MEPWGEEQLQERYALVIGINKYIDPEKNLYAPVNNANGIYELLTLGYSYKPENVELLTSIRETTLSSIKSSYC